MPSKRKPAREPGPVSPVLSDDSLDPGLDAPGGVSLDDGQGLSLDGDGASLDDAPAADPEDPLAGVKYTGNVEADAATELDALQSAFGDRARKERQRFLAATDSEYWVALCFQSRAQKEAFLTALRWIRYGDKYIDGTRLAGKLGIPLPPADVPFVTEKPDRTLDGLALPLE